MAVCVDVPGSLLQSIYKLARTQIDVENNPATKTTKLENLKRAVTSAAKTAAFMLYVDTLQVQKLENSIFYLKLCAYKHNRWK